MVPCSQQSTIHQLENNNVSSIFHYQCDRKTRGVGGPEKASNVEVVWATLTGFRNENFSANRNCGPFSLSHKLPTIQEEEALCQVLLVREFVRLMTMPILSGI